VASTITPWGSESRTQPAKRPITTERRDLSSERAVVGQNRWGAIELQRDHASSRPLASSSATRRTSPARMMPGAWDLACGISECASGFWVGSAGLIGACSEQRLRDELELDRVQHVGVLGRWVLEACSRIRRQAVLWS
jgi:hypothetical protein